VKTNYKKKKNLEEPVKNRVMVQLIQ